MRDITLEPKQGKFLPADPGGINIMRVIQTVQNFAYSAQAVITLGVSVIVVVVFEKINIEEGYA
jgi:hypothetical protein